MSWRLTILDRYMLTELGGQFAFGLSAFTLILVATQLLALSRLISDEHAPLWAALEYFLWGLPAILIYVIPMSMLLGVLLALQRLSGDSEITALKAGGLGLARIVASYLVAGFVLSLIDLAVQEQFVPIANDRATYLRNVVISQIGPIAANLTVNTSLPGGGRQLTAARAYESTTQTLRDVTVIQYDPSGKAQQIIFSERANYTQPTWTFYNANTYHFNADGSTFSSSDPLLRVDIGERPSQLTQATAGGNPDNLSRRQIAQVVASGQLGPGQLRQYIATYQEKLARPFACFVFALIAIPFGLRPARGGGTSMGFGIAMLIVFVYFVIASVCLSIGDLSAAIAPVAAWFPNVLFTAFGLVLLRRAGEV